MAWNYATWNTQSTAALQLSNLELHISEVAQAISASVTADGKSVDTETLRSYLADLRMERTRVEKLVAAAGGSNRAYARM